MSGANFKLSSNFRDSSDTQSPPCLSEAGQAMMDTVDGQVPVSVPLLLAT